MNQDVPITGPLAFESMPRIAAALRRREERILERWSRLVVQLLPDADGLTQVQVRDSLPRVLEQIAVALGSSDPGETEVLLETTRIHGKVRFHESFNLREVIIEYRLLRHLVKEELEAELPGTITTWEWIAVDAAVDVALQQAVLTFMEYQRQQLRRATEAEAKFLSFLAHDLRNSLNSILLTIQWVEQSISQYPELAEQHEGLHSIREGAMGTIESMERLLQAERLRKGVAVRHAPVELEPLLQEIAQQARPAAEAKGLRIETRVPPGAQLESDAGLLSLILQNLANNAVKYSIRGTIAIEAAPAVGTSGPGWQLRVVDQGVGIAADRLESLFEAFTRGETHGQPGVGLGLFIASQAARLLGSHLEVESRVGEGSTFKVVVRQTPRPEAQTQD